MVGAVEQRHLDVDQRVAGQHAELHGLLAAGVDRRDVLPRDAATGDLVLELVAAVAVAARAARCRSAPWRTGPTHRSASCGCSRPSRPSCGSSRGRRPAACRRWPRRWNSRRIRSTSTSRCSSPMPAMIVWPVSSSVRTWKVGSSSASRWIAMPSFSWSPLDFGSIATEMTGAGKFIDSRITGGLGAAQGVAGRGVLQAHDRDDLAGGDRLDLLALVGVHPVDLADPLLVALGAVEHLRCRTSSVPE